MKSKIKRISSDEDFQGVYDLYEGRKSIEELKWLYTNPENKEIYNAFVAKTEENKIVGVIAYSASLFKNNAKEVIGVSAFSWKVAPNIPGIHGILLIKKIFSLGDFVYAIGGSKQAMKFYPLLKYKTRSEYIKYYKILIPKIRVLNRSKKIMAMKSSLPCNGLVKHSWKNLKSGLIFEKYIESTLTVKEQNGVFQKKISEGYIKWLLSCPLLDTYAFNVMSGKTNLGVCILYIKNINSIKEGRIVYLPFLGEDIKIWHNVLLNCLEFFRNKNCILVSAIGHHQLNQLGLKKAGFIANGPRKRPISVSDENSHIENVNFEELHIQFSEDDQAYSGFWNQRIKDKTQSLINKF